MSTGQCPSPLSFSPLYFIRFGVNFAVKFFPRLGIVAFSICSAPRPPPPLSNSIGCKLWLKRVHLFFRTRNRNNQRMKKCMRGNWCDVRIFFAIFKFRMFFYLAVGFDSICEGVLVYVFFLLFSFSIVFCVNRGNRFEIRDAWRCGAEQVCGMWKTILLFSFNIIIDRFVIHAHTRM